MQLNVNYKNIDRSLVVENDLAHKIQKIKPIADNINKADVDIKKDKHGEKIIRLSVASPKHLSTSVKASHENVFTALNLACQKLKRHIVKAKNKLKVRKRKSSEVFLQGTQGNEPPRPFEEETVLIEENGEAHNIVYFRRPNKPRKKR